MYYEEKIINGVLSWRSDPEGGWTAYSIEELSLRYLALLKDSNWANYKLGKARSVLEFYADPEMWDSCEDDDEQGLRRCYITATCHPREMAQRTINELA